MHSQEVDIQSGELSFESQFACLGITPRKIPYPFLGQLPDGRVVVGYCESGGKYILKSLQNAQWSIMAELHAGDGHSVLGPLPQVVRCSTNVDLLRLSRLGKSGDYRMQILRVARNNVRQVPESVSDKLLPCVAQSGDVGYYGVIVGCGEEKYLLTGQYDEVHHKLSPDPQGYTKTCTLLVRSHVKPAFSDVETRGEFYVWRCVYAASADGGFESAWVRRRHVPGNKTSASVAYYSRCDPSGCWSPPTEVHRFPVGAFGPTEDLAVATVGSMTWIALATQSEGVSCVRLENGAIRNKTELTTGTGRSSVRRSQATLYGLAPYINIAVDRDGDVYVLWAANRHVGVLDSSGVRYNLWIRKNVGGRWADSVMIAEGVGAALSPNLIVDRDRIHIAYVQQSGDKKYKCVYREVKVTERGNEG
jgi:hypothetical protein